MIMSKVMGMFFEGCWAASILLAVLGAICIVTWGFRKIFKKNND